MSRDTSEPDRPGPAADISQDARVSGRGRSYQAARDQNITEVHVYGGPGPGVLDFAFAEQDIASAQDTVARVEESIGEHHRLVGLLLQMLHGLRQSVRTLTDERDALREELRARARADAELRETRARLDDTRQRLEEAERIQAETSQRLADVQRQQAEAELLKAEAAEKVRQMEEALASLRRDAATTAGGQAGQAGQVERTAAVAPPLMGETDQQLASDVLRQVDAALQREAANLSELREQVEEAAAPDQESLPAPVPPPTADPVRVPGSRGDSYGGGVPRSSAGQVPSTPRPRPARPAQPAAARSKPKARPPRRADLAVARFEPWSVMKITTVVAPVFGGAYVVLSSTSVFHFVATLPERGNSGWWLLTGLSALVPPILAASVIRLVNVLEPHTYIGAEITMRETEVLPRRTGRRTLRQAHLQIAGVHVQTMISMLVVAGIVGGGACVTYRLLNSSGALHLIAQFADRSVRGRIAVDAGLVAAFALVSVLMAVVSNSSVFRPPEVSLVETGFPRHAGARRARLALKRIGPVHVGLLSVVTGACVAAVYLGLYTTGALHQVYVFARHDTLDRFLATTGVVVAIVVAATLLAMLYNLLARLGGGLNVTLTETD